MYCNMISLCIQADFTNDGLVGYEKEVKMAFKVFNKNGFITETEVKWLFESIGEQVTDKQIRKMMKAAEADKEGKINYKQFSTMMKGILESQEQLKAGGKTK